MNQSIFLAIFHLAHRNAVLDWLGVFFAKYLAVLLVLGFIYYFFRERDARRRVWMLCEAALATLLARGIITEAIRFFYKHPRPFVVYNFQPLIDEAQRMDSFPSGHMTFFFALATAMFFINKKWGLWYLILSAVMGIARIYVGVHWPLDILGGALIGIASGIVVHFILYRYSRPLMAPRANQNPA